MIRVLLPLSVFLVVPAHAEECDVPRHERGHHFGQIAELPLTPSPYKHETMMAEEPSFIPEHIELITIPARRDELGNVIAPEVTEPRHVPNLFTGAYVQVRLSEATSSEESPSGPFALLDETGRQICQFATWQDYSDWRYAHLRPTP